MATSLAEEVLSDQKIPFNLEAETACLGAILLKNSVADEVFSKITAADFYDGRNRTIAEAISHHLGERRGMPVDLVTLTHSLRAEGMLERAGGVAYVTGLVDQVPTASNASHYAEIVREKSLLRRLIRCGQDIVGYATGTEFQVEEALEKSQQSLFELIKNEYADYGNLRTILKDTIDTVEKNYKNKGKAIGIETGFRDLDHFISGLHPSNFVIIGGRPGMGKTALVLSLIQNTSIHREEKVGVGIFSLEMSRMELCLRMLCAESRIPLTKFRKNALIESDWPKLFQGAERMHMAPIFIDDNAGLTIHELTAKARRMYQEGVRLIIVDYIQLMGSASQNSFMPREQFIASVSRSLKQLARELDIPIIGLTQLNRSSEARPGAEREPRLSDIRESGALEQDADIVLFIHRNTGGEEAAETQNLVDIIVAKNRHGERGKLQLFFNAAYTRFENYARGEAE